jgi:VWFA-related protein
MPNRAIVSAFLSFLLVFPAASQQTAQYGETLEVRVVNVDVIVTDRNGNPVTGLTQADFELFDNGKKKEISNFYEVNDTRAAVAAPAPAQVAPAAPAATVPAAAPAAPTITRRHILLFVDNTSLQPFNRNKVLTSVRTFLHEAVRPSDEVMIVSWNPSIREEVGMTNDLKAVDAALVKIQGESGRAALLEAERRRLESDLRQMIAAAPSDAGPSDSPSPGGGAMIGPGGSVDPGRLTPGLGEGKGSQSNQSTPYDRPLGSVRSYAEAIHLDTKQKSDALKMLATGMRGLDGRKMLLLVTEHYSNQPIRQMFEYLDTIKMHFEGGKYANPRAEILKYNDEPLFDSVKTAANAAGVTMYPISAAGIGGGGMDLADASASGNTMTGRPVGAAVGKRTEQSLQEIAAATGGLAVTGTNNFDLGLKHIASDLTQYYSLGYRADAPAKDLVRNIAVKVNRPGVVVRTHESIVQKSTPTEVRETTSANLVQGAQKNDLGITINPGVRKPEDADDVSLVVEIHVPVASLTFTPDGTDMVGKFSVNASSSRSDGVVSAVSKNEYPLRIPAATMKDQRNINLRLRMTVHKLTDTVSIGVVDETSHATGYATAKLP